MYSLYWFFGLIKLHFYRPPTKLWDGNVFNRGCQSVEGGGPHTTPPPVRGLTSPGMFKLVQLGPQSDLSLQGPAPLSPLPTWTCWNLYNMDSTIQRHPPPDRHVEYVAYASIRKWVVDIRLQCLLVIFIIRIKGMVNNAISKYRFSSL